MIRAIATFGLFLAVPALAGQGGSGMRGGAGVLCAGDRAPILLEDYVAFAGSRPTESVDPDALIDKIPDAVLRAAVRANFAANGPTSAWATIETIRAREAEFRRWSEYRLDPDARAYLDRLFFGPPENGKLDPSFRVFDEELDENLGRHCAIVQLAVTGLALDAEAFGPILLPAGGRLPNERQFRLLALHEAVHLVGARMGHQSAIPTRRLIVSLLRFPKGDAAIAAAARTFLAYVREREALVAKAPDLAPLREGRMVLVRSAGPDRKCPDVRRVSYAGDGTLVYRDVHDVPGDYRRPFAALGVGEWKTLFRAGECAFTLETAKLPNRI